jgi:hypothetical protein
MLGEVLIILAVVVIAGLAALLKSLEVRAATETEPEPDDEEHDAPR